LLPGDDSYHRPMADWLSEAKAIDTAVYGAIAASETPSLDVAIRSVCRTADHSKLWFVTAAAMALFGGSGSRHAVWRGLFALCIASGFANLVAKPLTTRRRPERKEAKESARRHVQMPFSSSFPSGHAASAFAFATGAGNAQPALSAPLRAVATLVGYSRVHTGSTIPQTCSPVRSSGSALRSWPAACSIAEPQRRLRSSPSKVCPGLRITRSPPVIRLSDRNRAHGG
jgi:hypothetical protein